MDDRVWCRAVAHERTANEVNPNYSPPGTDRGTRSPGVDHQRGDCRVVV